MLLPLKITQLENRSMKANILKVSAAAILFLSTQAVQADQSGEGAVAIDKWQVKMLVSPTSGQIAHEQEGFVFIYDGLTDKHVNDAMDMQFDRIDAMMFTRVKVTDDQGHAQVNEKTGEFIVEDDGCD